MKTGWNGEINLEVIKLYCPSDDSKYDGDKVSVCWWTYMCF